METGTPIISSYKANNNNNQQLKGKRKLVPSGNIENVNVDEYIATTEPVWYVDIMFCDEETPEKMPWRRCYCGPGKETRESGGTHGNNGGTCNKMKDAFDACSKKCGRAN